jgi:hypothetical protein
MSFSAEELPVAIVIMGYIKDRSSALEDMLTTENGRGVRLLKWPSAVESVPVLAHDA